VPAVILIAIITFAVWAIWGPEPRLAHAPVNAVLSIRRLLSNAPGSFGNKVKP